MKDNYPIMVEAGGKKLQGLIPKSEKEWTNKEWRVQGYCTMHKCRLVEAKINDLGICPLWDRDSSCGRPDHLILPTQEQLDGMFKISPVKSDFNSFLEEVLVRQARFYSALTKEERVSISSVLELKLWFVMWTQCKLDWHAETNSWKGVEDDDKRIGYTGAERSSE